MWRLFIFSLIISTSSFASNPEDVQNLLDILAQENNIITRLEKFSKRFIGLPYGKGGPLGEGPTGRYDQDPLYRFDTFDCTTFVETMLSLSLARSVSEFEDLQDKIRYEDGDVDYLKRNHFPSLQWIPNNVANGLLIEINNYVLPNEELKLAEAIINLPGWLSKISIDEIRVPMASLNERESLLKELRSLGHLYKPRIARLNYLPINGLVQRPELLERIPNGSIVNFVRPNWDLTEVSGTHMNVSHQGLIFVNEKGIYLRHASTSGFVKEEKLFDYLKSFVNHPTLKGIQLMQINHAY